MRFDAFFGPILAYFDVQGFCSEDLLCFHGDLLLLMRQSWVSSKVVKVYKGRFGFGSYWG
jgi:hypothetical protein